MHCSSLSWFCPLLLFPVFLLALTRVICPPAPGMRPHCRWQNGAHPQPRPRHLAPGCSSEAGESKSPSCLREAVPVGSHASPGRQWASTLCFCSSAVILGVLPPAEGGQVTPGPGLALPTGLLGGAPCCGLELSAAGGDSGGDMHLAGSAGDGEEA